MSHALLSDALPAPHGSNNASQQPQTRLPPKERALNLVRVLMGNCFCDTSLGGGGVFDKASTQFVELHGILFIGLGCMSDELTPSARVYDTLQQLSSRTARMVSIGYLVDDEDAAALSGRHGDADIRKMTQTVPLDVWRQTYPQDAHMSKPVQKLVDALERKDLQSMMIDLTLQLTTQKAQLSRGNNRYLAGITAHNLAVVKVLAGDSGGVFSLFEEAISLKESAFGSHHFEVALSWDELGIQLFAKSQFESALAAFKAAKMVRSKSEATHPSLAMVLNNIACCDFQMKNYEAARATLEEARAVQQAGAGPFAAKADLDLLHTATVMSNCGYLDLCLRRYDEARTHFEEALLIQQSVLDDNHRAVRDTLSNLAFTNAFHA